VSHALAGFAADLRLRFSVAAPPGTCAPGRTGPRHAGPTWPLSRESKRAVS